MGMITYHFMVLLVWAVKKQRNYVLLWELGRFRL